MRTRNIICGLFLLGFLLALTTCQYQFNKLGNGVSLQVLVPGNLSGATKSMAASSLRPRSLFGGASITVTITQGSSLAASAAAAGPTTIATQTEPINGSSTVDFSFSLSSGSYNATAVMEDAAGNEIAQKSTAFAVPAGNFPVVITLLSALLSNLVVSDTSGVQYPLEVPFSPTTYNYPANASYYISPIVLTPTTVDPKATMTVTQYASAVTPVGSNYTVSASLGEVTIVVTAADGSWSVTYTWSPNAG